MDKSDIETRARKLQMQIWDQRHVIWPDREVSPLEMLDPEIAAFVLGVKYEFHEEIRLLGQSNQYEIAGLFDRQLGKIAVSSRFPDETIRFTGAHEIGHYLLHPGHVMHRDRPIKGLAGSTYNRAPQEVEADYFAACFLMPRKLVKEALESTFLTEAPFVFDDDAAFWLSPGNPGALLRPYEGNRDRAHALATAQSYGGRHFVSLSKLFRVSSGSMAIRLQELGLIQD